MHDEAVEEVPVCRQEPDGQTQVGSDSRIIRGQSSQTEGQGQKAINDPSVPVPKKKVKNGSKLIISAEVSRGVWDSAQDAVNSGKYANVSDLVRRAVCRELNKPIRLK